jgi:hypothetical protein
MLFKKVTLEKLIPKLKKSRYKKFFKLYISDYISKINPKIINIDSFISYNLETYNYYKKKDKQVQIYFHTYINPDENSRIIAVQKTLFISTDMFIRIYPQIPVNTLISNTYLLYSSNLYIDPEFRGRKLCIQLKNLVNQFAEDINVSYIIVDIDTNNYSSIACHESTGFKVTNIVGHKNALFYINRLKLTPTPVKKYIIGINYDKKSYIPKKFFTALYKNNTNWVEETNLSMPKNISFLYNVGCKTLHKIWPDIGNLFMPSPSLTNKSALVQTVTLNYTTFYKKYMMPTTIIDIENLWLYQKLFKKDKIFILRPSWEFSRKGIKIFSNFDDFNDFMKTEGIQEQNNARTKVNKDSPNTNLIHYIISEFLQNQLLFMNKVFNLRVFFLVTNVNNKWYSYFINPIIIHMADKTKSSDYTDITAQISSTGTHETKDFYFEDLIKEIGTPAGERIMHQILKILSKLFNIIRNDIVMKKWHNMKHAYEIFGLDFIISDKYAVKLVEFNDRIGLVGYPDFIFENMANAIINGTVNKAYDDRYKLNISKEEIIRIK